MRSTRSIVPVLSLALLAVSGCAALPPQQPAVVARTVHPALLCPPAGAHPLERDLTVPWASRTYVLEDGSLCRPDAE
jgi:hypothetical protein